MEVTSASEVATDGNSFDFEAVFTAEVRYVWNSLRRLGVRAADLDDATHDVFVAVHRHRGDYDPARSLRAWLFGFAARVAANHRRTQRRRREDPAEDQQFPDESPHADERLDQGHKRRLLARGLEALDADRRAVIVMHDLDGHPMPEIAAALGIPLNTAYSRLRLGREDLAAAVRRLQAAR
ncbi:RNA polymerase sigma factor RpoE [Minicystis rosea]|nr:RNA polymerase sigma factor RpoE [Minicystis rosea]